jgi:hypothetical protein
MKKLRQPLNVVALDAMSQREIEDHRIEYLSKSTVNEIEARRYFDELEVYMMNRFKEDYFARYDRWIAQAKQPDDPIDQNYCDATKLIASIIERVGKENFHQLGLMERQKHLGEMLYVK